MFQGAYSGKRVLLTGHTGFKGAWLGWWLLQLGADVTGFALAPPTQLSIFEQTGLAGELKDVREDVRDRSSLMKLVREGKFDFIFHLAAQPLVLDSYEQPAESFDTNVTGTLNLLEAIRGASREVVCVIVSTDKCYENRELAEPFREDDKLGGFDPYSASKAAMEIVAGSYRDSFFDASTGIRMATARAGNVIGGGDWQRHRIVPDIVRALAAGEEVVLRNPESVRPWQHVLEPLSGYLMLGAALAGGDAQRFCSAWNFGPPDADIRTVRELTETFLASWGSGMWRSSEPGAKRHEAKVLRLATERARRELGWKPVWNFGTTVERTAAWYQAVMTGKHSARSAVEQDLKQYAADATKLGLLWTADAAVEVR